MMGVKVGIGVGIPLSIIALLLGALLLMEKRSKQRQIGNKTFPWAGPSEMITTAPVSELEGATKPYELPLRSETE
jgi:hypothetical protein